MTLEEKMAELCEQHNLTVVDVGINTNQMPGARFSAVVHWDGFSNDGIPCVQGLGWDISTALIKALENMGIKRAAEPPVLPAFEIAAQ